MVKRAEIIAAITFIIRHIVHFVQWFLCETPEHPVSRRLTYVDTVYNAVGFISDEWGYKTFMQALQARGGAPSGAALQ